MGRKNIRWDFYSTVIIIIYSVLQGIRWPILPQFMDIYYHFLTAWGFNQAGGYSGWDFWQYAPVGRPHIYPPFFHIVLAFLMKTGISVPLLAKLCETAIPVIFIITLWFFIRENFGAQFSFFVLLAFSSSFYFYISLMNHIPATIGLIFGLLSVGRLLKRKLFGSVIYLTLCFYSHLGVSWFFFFAIIIFAFLSKEYSKACLQILIAAAALSSPVLFKQISVLRFISSFGFQMKEKDMFQLKIFDYVMAFAGALFIFSKEKKFRIFIAFFLASFIFLAYPYRLFSAEGFLPVVFLCGFFLDNAYGKIKNTKYAKIFLFAAAVFMLFFSPSLSRKAGDEGHKDRYRINYFDSALDGMLLAKGKSIWFPVEYISISRIIRANSAAGDIVYSPLNLAGVISAGISGRATANALLPEIGPSVQFDPFLVSKIIIFNRLDDKKSVEDIISKYRLQMIGETKTFILYLNNSCTASIKKRGVSVPFSLIIGLGIILILSYIIAKKYLT